MPKAGSQQANLPKRNTLSNTFKHFLAENPFTRKSNSTNKIKGGKLHKLRLSLLLILCSITLVLLIIFFSWLFKTLSEFWNTMTSFWAMIFIIMIFAVLVMLVSLLIKQKEIKAVSGSKSSLSSTDHLHGQTKTENKYIGIKQNQDEKHSPSHNTSPFENDKIEIENSLPPGNDEQIVENSDFDEIIAVLDKHDKEQQLLRERIDKLEHLVSELYLLLEEKQYQNPAKQQEDPSKHVEDMQTERIEDDEMTMKITQQQIQPFSSSSPSSDEAAKLIRIADPTPLTISPLPIPRERPASRKDVIARDPADIHEMARFPHKKIFPSSLENEGILCGKWQLIGASCRGFRHEKEGGYREDDFSIKIVDQKLALIALADGVGNKELARRGAFAAVNGITQAIDEKKLRRLISLTQDKQYHQELKSSAHSVLHDAFVLARKSVEAQARKDHVKHEQMQSTLMVLLVIPTGSAQQNLFITSAQIGDGAIYTREKLSQACWNPLLLPQIHGSGSEVMPFMYATPAQWEKSIRTISMENNPFIIAMTDGVADDIDPYDDSTTERFSRENFYQSMKQYTHRQKNSFEAARGLTHFLGYDMRGSADDRTVVCFSRLQ